MFKKFARKDIAVDLCFTAAIFIAIGVFYAVTDNPSAKATPAH